MHWFPARSIQAFLLVRLILSAAPVQGQRPSDQGKEQLSNRLEGIGLSASDIKESVVTSSYSDPGSGITHTYLRQRAKGVFVWPGIFGVHTAADGTILSWDKPPVTDIAAKALDPTPALDARSALLLVAAAEEVRQPDPTTTAYDAELQRTTFSISGATEGAEVALVWYPKEDGLTLA